jgi:hypothetical protein
MPRSPASPDAGCEPPGLAADLAGALRAQPSGDAAVVDPRRYTRAARDAVAREVTRLLGLLGSADSAAA